MMIWLCHASDDTAVSYGSHRRYTVAAVVAVAIRLVPIADYNCTANAIRLCPANDDTAVSYDSHRRCTVAAVVAFATRIPL